MKNNKSFIINLYREKKIRELKSLSKGTYLESEDFSAYPIGFIEELIEKIKNSISKGES